MVLPSRPDFEVLGVFNPAVARHNGDVVLLLRVAEAPQKMSAGLAAAPIYNSESGRVEIKRWLVTPKGPDVSDPRLVVDNGRRPARFLRGNDLRIIRGRGPADHRARRHLLDHVYHSLTLWNRNRPRVDARFQDVHASWGDFPAAESERHDLP